MSNDSLLLQTLFHSRVANLVKRLEGACSCFHGYPAAFFRHPDTFLLQIGEEPATRAVIRMRYIVAVHNANTGQFTSTSHCNGTPGQKGFEQDFQITESFDTKQVPCQDGSNL